MSVVILKREGSKLTIAADKIVISSTGFADTTEKLFKLDNGIVMGITGYCEVRDMFIDYFSNTFNLIGFKCTNAKLSMLTKSINDFLNEQPKSIIKKFSTLIVVILNKVYYIEINNDGELSSVVDITDREFFGIGYCDMPLGAMAFGASPKEAILACSKYNSCYGNGVTKIEIDLSEICV